jgi:uncharacterized protein
MQDWEEQRELFPTRRKLTPPPPPRPRIRPNFFAKLARTCAGKPALVLVSALFFLAVAASLAALNLDIDLKSAIGISINDDVRKDNEKLAAEFPGISTLIVVRVSADAADPAKAAAQALVATLKANKASIAQAFVPGIGPYYDRFGFYYLDAADVAARVELTAQLNPLFQALAISPDLSGLSALITQVASAVKAGRSPKGLENLFLQISETISAQVAGKPHPLDWRAVAGLSFKTTTQDWVVLIEPHPKRLRQARQFVEAAIGNLLQAQPTLKLSAEFPQESSVEADGSVPRQFVVGTALALLLSVLSMIFGLKSAQRVVLVIVPVLTAVVAGAVAAALMTTHADRVVLAFLPAVILPIAALAGCMAAALTRPPPRSVKGISFIMLAFQELGFLVLTLGAMSAVTWLAWLQVTVGSMSELALVAAAGLSAGLAAICLVVPSLAIILPRPSEDAANDDFGEELVLQWRGMRPIFTIFLISASLFCIVFFSSLHYRGNAAQDVTRGLQFVAADEQAANKLFSDLKAVPEVGTVRWMGTFLPGEIPQKQKLLQGLTGALAVSGTGSAVGPNSPVANLQAMEAGLRIISDDAGTDEGLRTSAHELRRALSVFYNTSTALEPAAVELQSLIFSGFSNLPKQVDELSSLAAPQPRDFDADLRKLFISDGGKWRLEALPKRVIAPEAFLDSVGRAGTFPLGPLVIAQAEVASLKGLLARPIILGFVLSLLIALAYLRRIYDWFIVIAATLMPLPLFAALCVTTDTAIEPLAIPALIITMTASATMAMLSVARKRNPHISWAAIFLPVALVVAMMLPLQLLQIRELQALSRALLVFLLSVVVINVVVVQQLCAWTKGRARPSSPRKQSRKIPQPEENFDDGRFYN